MPRRSDGEQGKNIGVSIRPVFCGFGGFYSDRNAVCGISKP